MLNIDTTIGHETPEAFTVALYSDTGLGPETPDSFSLLCSSLTPAWGWRLLAPQKVLYPMLTCLAYAAGTWKVLRSELASLRHERVLAFDFVGAMRELCGNYAVQSVIRWYCFLHDHGCAPH